MQLFFVYLATDYGILRGHCALFEFSSAPFGNVVHLLKAKCPFFSDPKVYENTFTLQ